MTFPHQLVDPSQEKKAESERSNKHPIRMRKRCLLFLICKTDQVIARDDLTMAFNHVRSSSWVGRLTENKRNHKLQINVIIVLH